MLLKPLLKTIAIVGYLCGFVVNSIASPATKELTSINRKRGVRQAGFTLNKGR